MGRIEPGSGHYRHVFWDWNGTLHNDACLCVDILNRLLARRGYGVITLEDYQAEFDFPVVDYYQRIGFDFTSEDFEVVAAEYIMAYDTERYECPLQPGVREALELCREAGLTQSILSAYQQSRLEQIIDYFGLRRYFTSLHGLTDHYATSKVELGRATLAALGHEPDEVLMVGDTLHDYEVAEAIGIDCVLFSRGHHPHYRLEAPGVPVVATLEEAARYAVAGSRCGAPGLKPQVPGGA